MSKYYPEKVGQLTFVCALPGDKDMARYRCSCGRFDERKRILFVKAKSAGHDSSCKVCRKEKQAARMRPSIAGRMQGNVRQKSEVEQ